MVLNMLPELPEKKFQKNVFQNIHLGIIKDLDDIKTTLTPGGRGGGGEGGGVHNFLKFIWGSTKKNEKASAHSFHPFGVAMDEKMK